MALEELNQLQWGFPGSYGRVLYESGLFAQRQRGQSWDWYYIPTEHFWSLFAGKPELVELLPVLKGYILAEAYERAGFPDCSLRRRHAEAALKRLGITEEGQIRLRELVRHYAGSSALGLVYAERSGGW